MGRRRADGTFPKPRFQRVADSAKGRHAWKFFEFWQSLSPANLELTEVWVYRLWPKIDVRQVDPEARSVAVEILMGACPIQDPRAYEEYFRDKYGCGEYRCSLNESGVGEVMRCYFNYRENLDAYPPKLDIRNVVQNCPENEPYYNWCHRNGILFPWEKNQEDEDMSGVAEALKSTTDAVISLAQSRAADADARAEMSEQLSEARMEAMSKQGPSAEQAAAAEAIGLVTNASREAITMFRESAGKPHDTVELIKAVAELSQGKNDTAQVMAEAFKLVQDANKGTMEAMRAEISGLRDLLKDRATPTPATAPKSMMEQVQEFETMARVLGWDKGSRERSVAPVSDNPPAVPQESWFNERTAPVVMMVANTAMLMVANVVHNWAVAKLSTKEKLQDPGEVMKAVMEQQPGAQPAADTPTEQQREQQEKVRQGWATFIESISEPFIAHFYAREASGYKFAAWILSEGQMGAETPNGRHTFDAIVTKLGKPGFNTAIRGCQAIWSKVQGMREQYSKFVDEFLGYDAWAASQREAAASQPTPTPVNGSGHQTA